MANSTTSSSSVGDVTEGGGDDGDMTGVLFYTLNGQQITAVKLLFYSVQIVVAAFILALNGFVLDTMVRQGKSREPADLLVAGLALTDALTGVFVLWVTVYTLVYFQTVYECLTRLGLAHSMMITGMLHLLGLTADRFLKIVTPYRYNSLCQKWTVWVAMATMWVTGITLGSLPTFGWNGADTPRDPDDPPCSYFSIMDDRFLSFFLSVMSAIMIVIVLLYCKLFGVARRHATAIAAMTVTGDGTHATKVWDHAWRYTKTVLVIIGVNYVCWLPTGILVVGSITGTFGDMSTSRKGDFMLYTSTLVYCNSLLNPLIYAMKIPAIRHRYRAIFCCCRKHYGDDRPTSTAVKLSVVPVTKQSTSTAIVCR